MTSLSYIQYQTYISSRNERHFRISNIFSLFSHSRFITSVAVAWIAIAVVIYFVAVYSFFGLGVTLQEKSSAIKDLIESNTITELNLQQRQTEFARNNKNILESMQKISDMRYVLPTDTAVSQADILDRSSQ